MVSSYPHRLVGMGYNGLPDGGFREEQNILEPDGQYREREDIVGIKKKNYGELYCDYHYYIEYDFNISSQCAMLS